MLDLVFDVGAHKGETVNGFFEEGYKKVVAVEPNPQLSELLDLRFRDYDFVLIRKALSSYEGEIDFYLGVEESTISTVSEDWITDSRFTPNYNWWDTPMKVECTTLDNLIDEFGEPNLIKIDVENHEHEVLKGLSKKIDSNIKFEWHEEKYENAQEACQLLVNLEYLNFSCVAGTEGGVDNFTLEAAKDSNEVILLEDNTWEGLDAQIKKILPSQIPSQPYWGMIFAQK
tara:strand:+ start:860 stop:1546 length:687 start_codon:yes stop_codon:yes gene_type:complete